MAEIFLFVKNHDILLDEIATFVLLVPNMGFMPTFTFEMGGRLLESEPYFKTYTSADDVNLKAHLREWDLAKFQPNDKYLFQKQSFSSSGRYTVKVYGYNKKMLARDASVDINVVSGVRMLRFLVSDTLTLVNKEITIVVVLTHFGENSTYLLKASGWNNTKLDKFEFSRTITPITNFVQLFSDDIREFEQAGFFYNVTKRSFTSVGRRLVSITVFNRNVQTARDVEIIEIVKEFCEPSLNITNAGPDAETSVAYYRKDNLLFGTETNISCDYRIFMSITWDIYKQLSNSATADFSESKKVLLPRHVKTTERLLHIKRNILSVGTYVVRAQIVINQKGNLINSKGYGWFKVLSTIHSLKILGGLVRTANRLETLKIEVIDEAWVSEDDFEYEWYCSTSLFLDPAGKCNGLDIRTVFYGPQIVFFPRKFPQDAIYTFKVSITENGRSIDDLQQDIILNPERSLSIVCLANCLKMINPEEKLVLEALCGNFDHSSLTWQVQKQNSTPQLTEISVGDGRLPERLQWYINSKPFEGKIFSSLTDDLSVDENGYIVGESVGVDLNAVNPNWKNCSVFGDTGDILYLTPGCLEPGATYIVTAELPGVTNTHSKFAVHIDTPPSNGKCIIDPKEGEALITKFTILCDGFTHPDGVLVYHFFYNNHFNLETDIDSELSGLKYGILLKRRYEPFSRQFYLPVGNPFNNYTGTITILVSNHFGLSVKFIVTVKVKPPKALNSGEIMTMVDVSKPGTIRDFLTVTGDFESALNLANCVVQILNSNISDLTDEGKKRLRKALIQEIGSVPQLEIGLESGVLNTLAMILRGDEKEISTETAANAVLLLKKIVRKMKHTIKESSMITSQIYRTSVYAFNSASSLMRLTIATLPFSRVIPLYNVSQKLSASTQAKCDISKELFGIVDEIADSLLLKQTRADKDMELVDPFIGLYFRKIATYHHVSERLLGNPSMTAVRAPRVSSFVSNATIVKLDIKLISSPYNPFLGSRLGTLISAPVISLLINKSDHAAEMPLITASPRLVEFFLKRQGKAYGVSGNISTENFPYITEKNIKIHEITVPIANITTNILIEKSANNFSLLLTWTPDCRPTLSDFKKTKFVVPPGNLTAFFTLFRDDLMIPQAGKYIIGLLPYTFDIAEWLSREDQHFAFDRNNKSEILNYNLTYMQSRCMYLQVDKDTWSDEGCEVGEQTDVQAVHCICNHMTVFSASFLAIPNFVDVTKTAELFATAKDNMVVIAFTIGFWVIYIVMLVYENWSKFKEKIKNKPMVVLKDNNEDETYPYVIEITTGPLEEYQ